MHRWGRPRWRLIRARRARAAIAGWVQIMNDDIKETIEQLANSLQTVTLLSTRLRRQLGESAQEAVELEAAADRAVRAIKRLKPPEETNP